MSSNWYHPYERTEASSADQRERRIRFAIDQAAASTSTSLVEAIKKNIESLGGVMPGGGAVPRRVDSASDDSLAMNGSEPATGATDAFLRRAIRGSHGGEAAPVSEAATSTQLMPLASAGNVDQVYQPLPSKSIANSSAPASAPSYTVEFVSVAPGIQIQKKKFLPRYLPMPIGTPPGGLGRPILGRGGLLYGVTPQRSSTSGALSAGVAPSADGGRNDSTAGPAEYHPLRGELSKWPFPEMSRDPDLRTTRDGQ